MGGGLVCRCLLKKFIGRGQEFVSPSRSLKNVLSRDDPFGSPFSNFSGSPFSDPFGWTVTVCKARDARGVRRRIVKCAMPRSRSCAFANNKNNTCIMQVLSLLSILLIIIVTFRLSLLLLLLWLLPRPCLRPGLRAPGRGAPPPRRPCSPSRVVRERDREWSEKERERERESEQNNIYIYIYIYSINNNNNNTNNNQ